MLQAPVSVAKYPENALSRSQLVPAKQQEPANINGFVNTKTNPLTTNNLEKYTCYIILGYLVKDDSPTPSSISYQLPKGGSSDV